MENKEFEYEEESNLDIGLAFNPDGIKVPGKKRFGNYAIDLVVFYLILTAIGIVVVASEVYKPDKDNIGLFYLVIYGIYFFYNTIMEGLLSQTVGKMIMGTIVVDERGNKISFGKAALRSLCRIIPFEAFSFLGEEGRGWHDTITNTYVIPKSAI